jgi:hypothetical protein
MLQRGHAMRSPSGTSGVTPKAKAAMIRTLALEEHNRTETILEQFDSKRREILHSRYRTFACVLKV